MPRSRCAMRVLSVVLVLTGLLAFGLSSIWARDVATAIETLPGGKWLSVPLPFLPLLLMLAGAALFRRSDH